MHLRPLYEKIVVKMTNSQTVTSQEGIVFAKNMSISKNTTLVAEVVAVGEGRLLQDGTVLPLKVKVGDKIIYSKMSGESYNDGKDDYTILSESNILSILED